MSRNGEKRIKIGFISLGCAKNRVNSEQMMYLLRQEGYFVTGETSDVDAVVLNTCGFIDSAKEEAIDTISELSDEKLKGSVGAIIVAGCFAQRYREQMKHDFPYVDAIVGTGSFDDIADVTGKVLSKKVQKGSKQNVKTRNDRNGQYVEMFGDIDAQVSETKRIISTSPIWAYIKIAEGCDNECAYCCIPSIRGRMRSRSLEAVIEEAEQLAGAGYKELIPVAQDITAYGLDLYGKKSLPVLLKKLGGIANLRWIRLLYLHPAGFCDELIDEIANNDRIVKYLDIPIQHINNDILQKMNRHISGDEIYKLFKKLRERISGVVFRTSVITGLPGERGNEFTQLCEFLREMRIERAGVFTYSPQEGTKAADMEYADAETATYRAEIIQEIQSEIMDWYNRSRIGSLTDVIAEDRSIDSKTLLTRSYAEAPEVDGYIRVKVKEDYEIKSFEKVRITRIEDGEPTGELLDEHCQ